jgi:anti-sigma regulatory factor (Ser/Thr protein kinase)
MLSSLPGVRRVGLALAEGGGRRLRFTASDRGGATVPDWCLVDAYDDVPLNAAVRTGQVVGGGLDDLEDHFPDFVARQREAGSVALAAVPLVAGGQTVGGYLLYFDRPPDLDQGHRRELARIGRELGTRLRRAQRGEGRRPTAADDPAPVGALVAEHVVAPEPQAVREARQFLRGALQEWGVDEETIDTAVLCLSELVTNAVIHSHAGCVVQVLLEDGVLTTTVRDAGSTEDATPEALDDPLVVHGRGLHLVEALADRWGYDLDTVGTTVWFVLDAAVRT